MLLERSLSGVNRRVDIGARAGQDTTLNRLCLSLGFRCGKLASKIIHFRSSFNLRVQRSQVSFKLEEPSGRRGFNLAFWTYSPDLRQLPSQINEHVLKDFKPSRLCVKLY